MKKTLQFIVTHWITLVSAAVAVGAIALCVMGMSSDKVSAEMKEAINRSGASSIGGLRSNPQNEETIRSEQERGKQFEQQYAETIAIAKRINAREVLMPGVFPEPEKAATPFEFKEQYKKAVDVLYKEIDGGTLPTDAEIKEEEQNVEDLKLLEQEQQTEQEAAQEDTRTPVARGTSRGGASRGTSRGGASRGTSRGGPSRGHDTGSPSRDTGTRGGGAPSAVRSGDEPKYDPVFRAQVEKAKSIRCYYDPAAFHVSPIVDYIDAPPTEDMWLAQVSLWVQQDVLKAVAELNEEATQGLSDIEACVQQSPVKHIYGIRVHAYETGQSDDKGGTQIMFPAKENAPAGIPEAVSPTGRTSDDQFDVIRFGLTAVVDQRDIQKVINKITTVNFYQCINVNYQSVDSAEAMSNGYFYGTEPVVLASFEFEGNMSREVYAPLMPKSIKTLLGISTD